jgi:ATP-dependent RNA helicase DDX23/PRP28
MTIGEEGDIAENITQIVEVLGSDDAKDNRLHQLMQKLRPPIIVFVNSHNDCDVVAGMLAASGLTSTLIHGGKSQRDREIAVAEFKEKKKQVLVATDVLSRGMDVKGVTAVINYDAPKDITTYTHRIGRTGRADTTGTAYTFIKPDTDGELVYPLIKKLKECRQ